MNIDLLIVTMINKSEPTFHEHEKGTAFKNIYSGR